MAEEDKESKTEEGTSKRLEQTEERGQFAQSRELTSAFVLLAAIMAFKMAGESTARQVMVTWQHLFSQAHTLRMTPEEIQGLAVWVLKRIAIILAPTMLSIMVAGIISNLIQTQGLKFSFHPLTPNFAKLNPMSGFGRILSKNGLVELLKSLFKIGVTGYIVYITIKDRFTELPALTDFAVGQIMSFMGEVGVEIMVRVLLAIILMAILDFSFQKFTYKESMKMSKQEVKDERKETEGDPMIKQRIRGTQLQMMRKRMMAAVPKADVIVTNPTHIAIAIKYDNSKHAAPVVIAKGMGYVAERIRELAKQHGIPIVEDKPLARTLYKTVEINQYVPAALYKAIAEILAYVFKLKGRRM